MAAQISEYSLLFETTWASTAEDFHNQWARNFTGSNDSGNVFNLILT